MRRDEKEPIDAGHLVFDFTGLHDANVRDLGIVLTARLVADPEGGVWARSLPRRTARMLEYLRLDHLFIRYPDGSGPSH